jgi:hypothetical protein
VTKPFSVEMLRGRGFEGFVRARDLYLDRCAVVPRTPGLYVVLRTEEAAPKALSRSQGGLFKGKDPTVDVDAIKARLIASTPTLYIGKGDQLQRRVRQLLDFGNGRPVGHYGGRLLWQLAGSDDYLIAWREDSSPRTAEAALLDEFMSAFGSLPFANLVR